MGPACSYTGGRGCRGHFSQIAIAIGVLTSNRGEGDEPFWQIGRGTRVPLQGGVDVVPLQGAIVVCHGWRGKVTTNFGGSGRGAIVVCHGWRGKVTTNFGGVDVVPLLGAIVRCHYSVLSLGRVTAASTGCHCSVPWLEGEGNDQL